MYAVSAGVACHSAVIGEFERSVRAVLMLVQPMYPPSVHFIGTMLLARLVAVLPTSVYQVRLTGDTYIFCYLYILCCSVCVCVCVCVCVRIHTYAYTYIPKQSNEPGRSVWAKVPGG
jgi:hypothetical protein